MTEQLRPPKRGVVAVRAESDVDVKKILADLKKAHEDFKAAHTEQLDEIKSGYKDVVKAEQVDRINAAVTDLQKKVDEALAAANKRTDDLELEMGRKGLGEGKDTAEDLKAKTKAFFATAKGADAEFEPTEQHIEEFKAYEAGFGRFLRASPDSKVGQNIKAAMSVGSDPDGGYWVPPTMSNDIKQRLFETSPMRQLASVITITTDSIKFPTDTNDATSGGWVGETDTRSVTATPQVGEQQIYVREQYASPKVTQKLLDMATINVEQWLGNKIADKMARTENTAYVSGTGVTSPRGFLDYKSAAVTTDDDSRSWGVLQYVASGASGGFPDYSGIAGANDASTIIDLISKLKPAYRAGANFVCNRATEATLRKLKDADGRYLVDMGNLESGATGFSLHGYTIVDFEDMPDLGSDSFSLAFGNFNVGYQIVDGRGLRVLRDPYTDKPYVIFYTTKWTGGDVVNFDAIKLMKFGS